MSKHRAFTTLLKMTAYKDTFPKNISDDILHDEEFIAPDVIYELANGTSGPVIGNTLSRISDSDLKAEKKSIKRKIAEDGSAGKSHKKVERFSTVQDTDDHSGCMVQSLCSREITEKSVQIPSGTTVQLYTEVTPDYYAEFSFSVIHLMSAVRSALVTPLPIGYALSLESLGESSICYKELVENNFPCLTIDQIVERLRSNPGDARTLIYNELVTELVRAVLKAFSSEVGPLGMIPLVEYERSMKHWRWIGPVPCWLGNERYGPVDISSISWGISQENLMKLVGQCCVLLRRVQQTIRLMASLPPPPIQVMLVKDLHLRFGDRKLLNQGTICPSTNETRAYFRREEAIRYMIPERSFKYTHINGEKSSVAPLAKSCEKALTKSRGHHIFKGERPAQFTLLSLVRDAAARLPDGVGTRTDICTLIRDSQYIIDDIEENTLKQIVSGALDRLQSESDPCVKYNGVMGFWSYLHGNREDEDYREHGTSSTKTKGLRIKG